MEQIHLQRVRQQFSNGGMEHVNDHVREELSCFNSFELAGKEIGLAVGSRGISNLVTIVREMVAYIKERGGAPFIFPAMGSHGGATAEGQQSVLEALGITEQRMQCPIKATMDVIELNDEGLAARVYMDAMAYRSDGIFLINRVKPHTAYHGDYESGLVKMAVIGVGKHQQALALHEKGVEGLKNQMPALGERILASGKILGGLALVEDAYDQTMQVKALKSSEILPQEPFLLKSAKQHMPSLPLEDLDLLIVDEIGKNISGTGMDSNIIGRNYIYGEPEPPGVNINQIIINDLSGKSQGNAVGMGLADVITDKLYHKINFQKTYENVYTSTFLSRAKVPVTAKNMEEALEFSFRAIGKGKTNNLRIARIKNTLHLNELYLSSAAAERTPAKTRVLQQHVPQLDENGDLVPFE